MRYRLGLSCLLAAGLSVWALSGSDDSSTPASPPAAITQVESIEEPVEVLPLEERERREAELKEWQASKVREALFAQTKLAAQRVARALESGELGSPRRYNEWKTDWMPGQEGWGGIALNSGSEADSNSPSFYAWVYFKPDGKIDHSRGVGGFHVDPGPKHPGVQIEGLLDEGDKRYHVFLDKLPADEDGPSYVTCFEHCEFGLGGSDNRFITTWSRHELAVMETTAVQTLQANMRHVFGPNWKRSPSTT